MTDGEFVHLRVASWYSLRYGTASPAALVAAARDQGMPALALTDRDGLYGAFKHAQACVAAGIAPILGADLAAASGSSSGHRVTLLTTGGRGWASLCRLVSAGRPVSPSDDLDGLVILLGTDSDVGHALAARHPDLAGAALRRWQAAAAAGGRRRSAAAAVAIEITDNRGPGDTRRARALLHLARQTKTRAVLTNSVRYRTPADSPLAQVLDATRGNIPLGAPGLPRHNGQAHLATAAEMAARANSLTDEADAARLLDDTMDLARSCYLDPGKDLGIGTRHLPGTTAGPRAGHQILRERFEQGLTAYRGNRNEARNRLDHELKIIAATDLASYFLTVADVAHRIRGQGIRCAIRGSGAGCLVNHLLGISAIDPLDYGLIMERFLSQTRQTMPDIDLDVESARRIEAYRVIIDAYGERSTATVCMMETYRARSAIRDVAAAFGLPRDEIGKIAKAFPHIRAAHIGAALTELPELRTSSLPSVKQLTSLFRLAERLDGMPRHVAMHPCGVLLSDPTLPDRTAITRSAADNLPLSQLDKDDAETAGVIKLDVLGVRMQSAMAYALTQIDGPKPDLDAIPRDDEPTFELIRSGRTVGCFQIESPGQRELVAKVAPRHIGDLITEISLFRPGPVNSDMITPYLAIRHGTMDATYPAEALREPLRETGGVLIFHEQVLRIIDTMTGCGLAEADRIRRSLAADAGKAETRFRAAAASNGYDQPAIDRIWAVLAAFGAFGFCKAHAAAFAIPVYQSAWLKRHHPAAFYAGLLTHDPGMYPKRVIVQDARQAGVRVQGPDISTSGSSWLSTTGGSPPALLTSLHEVKGITGQEVSAIVAGQPYQSLRDFWDRARVSRPVAERLITVGAFDRMYAGSAVSRRDLIARLGVLCRSGRPGLLQQPLDLDGDGFGDLVPAGELRDLDPAERVAAELDILGFDVSQHVLGFYTELLTELGVVRSSGLTRCRPGSTVLVAGVKVATQTPAIRSGQRIIFASLDDETGLVDLAFFESVQDRCAARLFGSWLLLVRGRVRGIAGGTAATVNALDCWDLTELGALRKTGGIGAVRDLLARSAAETSTGERRGKRRGTAVVYPTGFTLSPYAETGSPGAPPKAPPRHLWTSAADDGLSAPGDGWVGCDAVVRTQENFTCRL